VQSLGKDFYLGVLSSFDHDFHPSNQFPFISFVVSHSTFKLFKFIKSFVNALIFLLCSFLHLHSPKVSLIEQFVVALVESFIEWWISIHIFCCVTFNLQAFQGHQKFHQCPIFLVMFISSLVITKSFIGWTIYCCIRQNLCQMTNLL